MPVQLKTRLQHHPKRGKIIDADAEIVRRRLKIAALLEHDHDESRVRRYRMYPERLRDPIVADMNVREKGDGKTIREMRRLSIAESDRQHKAEGEAVEKWIRLNFGKLPDLCRSGDVVKLISHDLIEFMSAARAQVLIGRSLIRCGALRTEKCHVRLGRLFILRRRAFYTAMQPRQRAVAYRAQWQRGIVGLTMAAAVTVQRDPRFDRERKYRDPDIVVAEMSAHAARRDAKRGHRRRDRREAMVGSGISGHADANNALPGSSGRRRRGPTRHKS